MIGFAELSDNDEIMVFIDKYWKKNHILARDKNFFEYQYCSENKVDFVISRNKDGEINGILGYISYSKNNPDIMLALWKVVNPHIPMLGLRLMKFLIDNSKARLIASPGININTTKSLYEYLGFNVGKMNQWYRLGKKQEYFIAKIDNDLKPSYFMNDEEYVVEFESFEELENKFDFDEYRKLQPIPYKEEDYIKKRYFEHPVYVYRVFGIGENKKKISTFFVIRHEECNGSLALRLVDVVGKVENIRYATNFLDKLLEETGAEYVDLYEVGLSEDELLKAGWLKVEESGNVIPNYFSPFVQKNIDIYYSSNNERVVLFKGDGDQDRPS